MMMDTAQDILGFVATLQAIMSAGAVPVIIWLVRMEGRVRGNSTHIQRIDDSLVRAWEEIEIHRDKLNTLMNFREVINEIVSPSELKEHYTSQATYQTQTTNDIETLRRDHEKLAEEVTRHIERWADGLERQAEKSIGDD